LISTKITASISHRRDIIIDDLSEAVEANRVTKARRLKDKLVFKAG